MEFDRPRGGAAGAASAQGSADAEFLPGRTPESEREAAAQQIGRTLRAWKIHRSPLGEVVKLNQEHYLSTFGERIWSDLKDQLTAIAPPFGFAAAKLADPAGFMKLLVASFTPAGDPIKGLYAQLVAPAQLSDAIDRGRDATDGESAGDYKPGVALELHQLFAPALSGSLQRMVPRYLRARNQKALEHPLTPTLAGEPNPDDLIFSHPLDRPMAKALCGGLVTFDAAEYQKAHPDEKAEGPPLFGKLRKVTCTVLEQMGGWWVKADPADATVEEVAKELYGDEAQAFRLKAAPPLFGFDDATGMSPLYAGQIKMTPKKKEPMADWSKGPEYDQNANNEIALLQTKNLVGTNANVSQIVERMNHIRGILEDGDRQASVMKSGIHGALSRIDVRIEGAKKGMLTDAMIPDWDAQTAAQLEVLKEAAPGLRAVSMIYQNLDGGGVAQDVWEKPLGNVSTAFIASFDLSDMPDTARAKLAEAKELAQTFGIELCENILAKVRKRLAGVQGGKDVPSTDDLSKKEEELRKRLAQARDLFLTDPARASQMVDAAIAEVDDLDEESSFIASMDETNQAWQELEHATDMANTNNSIDVPGAPVPPAYPNLHAQMEALKAKWNAAYAAWKSGDHKGALEMAKAVSAEAGPLFKEISAAEHSQEMLTAINRLLALLGVGVLTGGIGTAAESLAGGGLLGEVAAVGAESFTFSAMSEAMEEKPSLSHFFKSWMINAATMGVSKAFSKGYANAVGGAEAVKASVKLQGGDWAMQIFVQTNAQLITMQIEKPGQQVSNEDLLQIITTNTLQVVLSGIIARCTEPFMEDMKDLGEELRGKIANIRNQRTLIKGQAEALLKSNNVEAAQKTLEAFEENNRAEEQVVDEILKDPALKDNPDVKKEKTVEDLAFIQRGMSTLTAGLEAQTPTRFIGTEAEIAAAKANFEASPESKPAEGKPKIEITETTPGETEVKAPDTEPKKLIAADNPAKLEGKPKKINQTIADDPNIPNDVKKQIGSWDNTVNAGDINTAAPAGGASKAKPESPAGKTDYKDVKSPLDAKDNQQDTGYDHKSFDGKNNDSGVYKDQDTTFGHVATNEALSVDGGKLQKGDPGLLGTSGINECAGVAITGFKGQEQTRRLLHPDCSDGNQLERARADAQELARDHDDVQVVLSFGSAGAKGDTDMGPKVRVIAVMHAGEGSMRKMYNSNEGVVVFEHPPEGEDKSAFFPWKRPSPDDDPLLPKKDDDPLVPKKDDDDD